MTIDIQRFRDLLRRATPGPVEVHRNDRDSGKFSFQVQSYGTGDVLCNHEEYDSKRARWDAELHAEMRNALAEILDAAERWTVLCELADRGETMCDALALSGRNVVESELKRRERAAKRLPP